MTLCEMPDLDLKLTDAVDGDTDYLLENLSMLVLWVAAGRCRSVSSSVSRPLGRVMGLKACASRLRVSQRLLREDLAPELHLALVFWSLVMILSEGYFLPFFHQQSQL